MRLDTLGVVLASASIHAYWNYLLRRARGDAVFVGLTKLAEAALLAPAFALVALPDARFAEAGTWGVVAGGAALTLANYVALGRAYATGDLVVAYPVARGGALLVLPLLGAVALGERVTAPGWVALAAIVAGIALLARAQGGEASGGGDRGRAVAFAALAAVASAGYTVWDARAVRTLPAFAYFYAYTALVAAAYGAWLVGGGRAPALRTWLRAHRWPIAQVAVCNAASYLLVLVALRTGPPTYVVAARQVSVVFGALLGWRVSGEPMGRRRLCAIALISGGALVVASLR